MFPSDGWMVMSTFFDEAKGIASWHDCYPSGMSIITNTCLLSKYDRTPRNLVTNKKFEL